MSVVLDTDHCVAVLRGRLDLGRRISRRTPLFVTSITVGELIDGALRSERREANVPAVDVLLEGVTVLPYDEDAARRFAALRRSLEERGERVADPDLQIAAIALEHALPVATHNRAHFERVQGLALEDWIET